MSSINFLKNINQQRGGNHKSNLLIANLCFLRWFSANVRDNFVSAEHFKQTKLLSAENSGLTTLSDLLQWNLLSLTFLNFLLTFLGSGVFFADGGCWKSTIPRRRVSMSEKFVNKVTNSINTNILPIWGVLLSSSSLSSESSPHFPVNKLTKLYFSILFIERLLELWKGKKSNQPFYFWKTDSVKSHCFGVRISFFHSLGLENGRILGRALSIGQFHHRVFLHPGSRNLVWLVKEPEC